MSAPGIPSADDIYRSLNPDAAGAPPAAPAGTPAPADAATPVPAGSIPDADTIFKALPPPPDTPASTPADKPDKPKEPPKKTIAGFGANVLSSTGNLIGNTVKAIVPYDAWSNPDSSWNDRIPLKRASDQLFDLFVGAGRDAAKRMGIELPENQSADQAVEAARNYVETRYGSWDNFTNSWYNDPAGMANDALVFAHPVMSRIVRALTPGSVPAFDPATATFEGDVPAYDLKGGEFDTRTRFRPGSAPAPPPAPDVQALIRQRAYDIAKLKMPEGTELPGATQVPSEEAWRQAGQEFRERPPKAPEQPNPPAAAPVQSVAETANKAQGKIASFIRNSFVQAGAGGALTYEVVNLLSHHLAGSLLGGGAVAAARYLPEFLKTPAGQQMLARLGPGSKAAAIAAVAHDMTPALNAFHKNQQLQQPLFLGQPYAGGGLYPNPQLARIQNERLGLHTRTVRMLQKR